MRSQVTFVCMDGFILDGITESICLTEKIWSEELPACVSEEGEEQRTVNLFSPLK